MSKKDLSEFIRSYVRVRSNLPTETGASCLNLKGVQQAEVKRPNEPLRTVDKVFNAESDDTEIWDAAGSPCVEKAQEGKQTLICVFGEVTSGKTHTVRGKNGGEDIAHSLVGGIIQKIAGGEDSNMCILYMHNEICQDLSTGVDNLKLKFEETGTSAEGSTTVRIPNAEAGYEHVKKCIAKRDTFFATTPFNETLTYVIYIFGVGAGKITVIEFPGSERVAGAPLSLTPDMNKETTNKNKILGQLMKLWTDSATNSDPKALPWKDTKIGRFVQPGLAAAMDQTGFAVIITHVINNVTNVFETAANMQFAEQCVKLDGLKTVSEYKDVIAFVEERLDFNGKEKPTLVASAAAEEANANKVKAENEERIQELDDKCKALDTKLSSTTTQYANEIEKLKKDYEKKKTDLETKNNVEIDRMRNMSKNAPAQTAADIKKKVQEVEDENKVELQQVSADVAKLKTEIQDAKETIKASKASGDKNKAEETEAMKPVKELEKDLFKLKANMTFAMRNREEGLSPEEVAAKQPLWDIRDNVDDLDEDIQKILPEVMRANALFVNKVGKPAGGSSDDESSSSSSESDKSEESVKSIPETEEAKAARLLAEAEAKAKAKEEAKKMKLERGAYNREMMHFREAIRKDFFLSELLEKILMYIEYGCNCSFVTPNGIERFFLSMTNKRRAISLYPEVTTSEGPTRKNAIRCVAIDKVIGLHLGQHSVNFMAQLKKIRGRVDTSRSEPPMATADLNVASLHRYYYRSLSLQLARDEGNIDIICDSDTDFEAMVVAIHRMSGRNAAWGKPLFIDLADRVDDLSEPEKDLCSGIHIHPAEYLKRRKLIFETEDRLFVTLHDLRVLAALDLYHSQKLLEMWLKQKWIVRRQLNYWKYQEMIEEDATKRAAEEAALAAEKEGMKNHEETEENEEPPEAPPSDEDEDDD